MDYIFTQAGSDILERTIQFMKQEEPIVLHIGIETSDKLTQFEKVLYEDIIVNTGKCALIMLLQETKAAPFINLHNGNDMVLKLVQK